MNSVNKKVKEQTMFCKQLLWLNVRDKQTIINYGVYGNVKRNYMSHFTAITEQGASKASVCSITEEKEHYAHIHLTRFLRRATQCLKLEHSIAALKSDQKSASQSFSETTEMAMKYLCTAEHCAIRRSNITFNMEDELVSCIHSAFDVQTQRIT